MAAVVDAVPPATHGGGADTDVEAVAPAPTFVVLASAAACIAVSACVSGLLAYYATFALYLACFARAVWPDRVDAVLGTLDAHARRAALLARADLEADLRCLRVHPATAPACAAVARWAGGARRRAEAKWAEHRAAAGAAWLLLRLAGRAARIARNRAARRGARGGRGPCPVGDGVPERRRPRDQFAGGFAQGRRGAAAAQEEEEDDGVAGFELRDVVGLVGIAFYLLFSIRFILSFGTISATQFYGACLVMCGLAVMVADWIDPPEDDVSDDTDTTAGDRADDDATQQEGDDAGDQARLDAELEEVRESWQFMYVLIFMAFCFDALILHAAFGPQPLVLLLLAVCNFEVIKIGKAVQQPDDREGAEGSAAGVDEAVNSWRWGAVWVFVASSIKVFGIYLVVDFYVAALSFLWLCVTADFLLAEEDSLLELYGSGDDEDSEEGAAGSGEDVNGGAEERADEAGAGAAEHSDTSSSEDEEEDCVVEERCDSSEDRTNATSSEDEEEDYVLEEHCDSSEERTNATSSEDEEEDYVLEEHCDSSEERNNATTSEDEEEDATEEHCDGSEEHEHLKEERQEEPGCSRGGSMDDGWDLVEVDPEMPVKGETGANRKSSSLLPWK